ncbi:MAG TPA: hypothetical protein VHB30_05670, partial [Solirubrobacteraceae bacterium]|nr:hypothetical protein [Solirubrobacteraceae bacterium]
PPPALAPTAPPPPAPAPVTTPPTGLDDVLAVWPAVLDQLRADDMVLGMALAAGRPVELDGRELTIAFAPSDDFKRSKVQAGATAVADAVRSLAGAPVRLRVESRDGIAEAGERGAAAVATEDELVARFVAEFDAEEIDPDEEPDA